MRGVYIPESAQCPVCGRILPTYEDAQALLKELGLLASQGMCVCPVGAAKPALGFRRVDPGTGEMFDMPGLRHREE